MALDPRIVEAIEKAVSAGEITTSGAPRVPALHAVLGGEITSEQRDAWWAEYRNRPDDGSEAETGGDTSGEAPPPTQDEPEDPEPAPEVQADYGGPVMWIGPPVATSGGHVPHNQIFREGVLPRVLVGLIGQAPEAARLVIPPAHYVKTKAELRDKLSPVAKAYALVEQLTA